MDRKAPRDSADPRIERPTTSLPPLPHPSWRGDPAEPSGKAESPIGADEFWARLGI